MVIVARGPLSLSLVLGQDLCEKGPFFSPSGFARFSLSPVCCAFIDTGAGEPGLEWPGGGKKEKWATHLHLNDYTKNTTFRH